MNLNGVRGYFGKFLTSGGILKIPPLDISDFSPLIYIKFQCNSDTS